MEHPAVPTTPGWESLKGTWLAAGQLRRLGFTLSGSSCWESDLEGGCEEVSVPTCAGKGGSGGVRRRLLLGWEEKLLMRPGVC